VVNQAFVDDTECRNCTDYRVDNDISADAQMLRRLWDMSHSNLLDRLSSDECLSAYSTPIQSTRRNLLVLTANENIKLPVDRFSDGFPSKTGINTTNLARISHFNAVSGLTPYQEGDAFSWICTGLPSSDAPCINRIEEIQSAPQPWTIAQWPVN
jgi:hypothetical protein